MPLGRIISMIVGPALHAVGPQDQHHCMPWGAVGAVSAWLNVGACFACPGCALSASLWSLFCMPCGLITSIMVGPECRGGALSASLLLGPALHALGAHYQHHCCGQGLLCMPQARIHEGGACFACPEAALLACPKRSISIMMGPALIALGPHYQHHCGGPFLCPLASGCQLREQCGEQRHVSALAELEATGS